MAKSQEKKQGSESLEVELVRVMTNKDQAVTLEEGGRWVVKIMDNEEVEDLRSQISFSNSVLSGFSHLQPSKCFIFFLSYFNH